MPSKNEISEQIAHESGRRQRLGVPTAAGGVLYLISGIIINSTLSTRPTVGVLQGLAPALRGEANPAESPQASEIRFESHHAFGLIAGSVLAALSIAALTIVMLFILDATRFRRPDTNRAARPMVIAGGIGIAVLGFANEVVLAIRTHEFATGHDFSNHAVNAVTHNTGYDILALVAPLMAIVFAASIVITMLGAVKVGLLPRWMGMIGGLSALLLLLPAPQLDVVPAFWMVALGILLMGKWPKGDPPTWAAGESRPWPSNAEMRAARTGGTPKRGKTPAPAVAGAVSPAPDPMGAGAGSGGSGRRRRKRSSR
jgi:hypothetical protein